jgi:hypothetical protein
MAFDIKSFAAQIRPSPRRPSPEALDDSVFDAGSPQYVRPEDLVLDIQSQLFGLKRKDAKKDLSGVAPSDFRNRWLDDAADHCSVQRVGEVANDSLTDALMSLLRCPQRKNEKFPTLLPVVPALGHYKNIKPNLPNFWHDQLRPALMFAEENGFEDRVRKLKRCLCNGVQADDSLKQLAIALLPTPFSASAVEINTRQVTRHEGPLLKDYTVSPSRALPLCNSLKDAVDSLIALEASLPRIIWTRWLCAALRLWLPVFFLKRCSVTAAASRAMKMVLAGENPPGIPGLTAALISGNGLLRGSNEWLNQLTPILQDHVRARFEITIVLELANLHERLRQIGGGLDPTDSSHLQRVRQELDFFEVDLRRTSNNPFPSAEGVLHQVRLSMPGDVGPLPENGWCKLPFDEWLNWLVVNKQRLDALAHIIGGNDVADVADLVERVYAYVRPDYEPLRSGFGKNAHEYVAFALGAPRKADRDPEFPDEFNLIYRGEGGRRARQVVVQPGPQLLLLLVQLVSHQARERSRTTAKLADLLSMFDDMGVDFRSVPADFENLKSELLRLGLLQSSADAAEAASLNPAYGF